jgi:hypothetical protein
MRVIVCDNCYSLRPEPELGAECQVCSMGRVVARERDERGVMADPGWTECRNCNRVLAESDDLAEILPAQAHPCPHCGSRLICTVRPMRWKVCSCGRRVDLHSFTNSCDCGAEFNSFGQPLSDRSQWGMETGEHPADVARIP